MEKLLLMDFELNKPLTYLNKFIKMLKQNGLILDIFWARDYTKKKKPSLDEKINSAKFLIIRKPLTFLSSTEARKKLQNVVLKDKKSILLMYTFSDLETNDLVIDFLQPFNISPSEIKLFDNKTNLKNKRIIVFQKKNKCFLHNELFNGVSKVIIPDAHHITVEPPAKIMIRGNPTTDGVSFIDGKLDELSGAELVAGAYYEETGRIILINSTLFLDGYFDYNKKFIKNIITWLGENKKDN